LQFFVLEESMPREPQSYGSNEDWVTGRTDQKVNDTKSAPTGNHRDFYDERRESETSAPHQGGHTSDAQLAEGAAVPESTSAPEVTQTKINTSEGGAKRDSFFRKRDYE
jgi:hypothetical protein